MLSRTASYAVANASGSRSTDEHYSSPKGTMSDVHFRTPNTAITSSYPATYTADSDRKPAANPNYIRTAPSAITTSSSPTCYEKSILDLKTKSAAYLPTSIPKH